MDSMYAHNVHSWIMHRRGSLNHIDKAQELTCECHDRGSDGKSEISNITSEKFKRIFRVRLILAIHDSDEIYIRKGRENEMEKKQTTFVKNGRQTFRTYCSFEDAIAE